MFFKKKGHQYFLSYNFKAKSGSGFGNMTATFEKPLLKGSSDVPFIQDFIKKSNEDIESVLLLNIINIKS